MGTIIPIWSLMLLFDSPLRETYLGLSHQESDNTPRQSKHTSHCTIHTAKTTKSKETNWWSLWWKGVHSSLFFGYLL